MSESITLIFQTHNAGDTISISNISNVLAVDWGDGDTGASSLTHTYSSAGTYTCKIYGPTAIATNAFTDQSCVQALTEVTCSEEITAIGGYAFAGCTSLHTVILSQQNSLTLGTAAFYHCYNLSSLTLADGISTIPNNAFTGHALKTINIPDTVNEIAASAFSDSTALTSVFFGDNLDAIGSDAFANCPNLASITFTNPTPPIDLSATAFPSHEIQVNVPAGSVEQYCERLANFSNLQIVGGSSSGGDVGSGDNGGSGSSSTASDMRHVTLGILNTYNAQLKTNYIDKLADKLTEHATSISNRIRSFSSAPEPSGGIDVSVSRMYHGSDGENALVATIGLSTTETFILDGGTSSSVS